jgi:hypothetical protein
MWDGHEFHVDMFVMTLMGSASKRESHIAGCRDGGHHVFALACFGALLALCFVLQFCPCATARAGVYVAVAAGNAGPAPSVEALSPWVTTVAASTHDR